MSTELGKFITSDNNGGSMPAAVLIYLIYFVGLFRSRDDLANWVACWTPRAPLATRSS